MPKRILVVEDNPMNLKLFQDVLTAYGYEVMAAETGQAALDIVRDLLPDLVILDIQLPDISGLDIARKFKDDDRLKTIPIVAVTSFAMAGDEEKALAMGCDAYITKPISIASFAAEIEKMLPKSR
jgi:two-component system, cell cycle response regulator DivK